MAKITKSNLVVAVLLTASLGMWAGDKKGPNTTILNPVYKGGYRPRVPSAQEVICNYIDDYVYITFAIPEGECEFFLTDLKTGECVYSSFDSENPEPMYVGHHETAEVTVTTANDHTYTGSW